MSDLKPKKKPRGRPFVKGQRANPHGRPKKTLAAADEHFLDAFFDTVDVLKTACLSAPRNSSSSWKS